MKIKRTKGPGYDKLDKFILDPGFDKDAKIGWFPKNRYPDGQFVAQVAAWQEFGAEDGRFPPRPFMRPTIKEKRNKWKKLAEILTRKVLDGQITQTQALEQLSLVAEGNVRNKIKSIKTPPLAESTIKARISRKKSKARTASIEKPLVDTAIMINTLTKVIE